MSDYLKLLRSIYNIDWDQVAINGGPPCFHVEDERRFCLRAKRWQGHYVVGEFHKFVSLQDVFENIEREEIATQRRP